MPIDLLENKYYNFSYSKFKRIIKEKADMIFNEKYSNLYCDKWINYIKSIDKNLKYHFEKNNTKIQNSLYDEGEIFQKIEIIDKDCLVYYHFKISYLRNMLKQLNWLPQEIKLEEFTCKNRIIDWEKQKLMDENLLKKEPIIMLQFPSEDYDFIVIDGNHRISNEINKGSKQIQAFCLTTDFIIENNVLLTDFEKIILILKKEILNLYQYKKQHKFITNKELFKCSSIYPLWFP